MGNRNLILNSFVLKIIAMVAVLSDHIAYAFLSSSSPTYLYMRIFGRIAFILFAFFISEGVTYNKNKDKYLLRLAILYVVMQIFIVGTNLYDPSFIFNNIFATLLASASALVYFEKREWKKVYYLIPIIVISAINYLSGYQGISELEIWAGDYGMYGIAIIFGFYIARQVATILLYKFPPTSDDEDEELSPEEVASKSQVIYNSAASVSLLFITFIWYILNVFSLGSMDFGIQSFGLITLPLLLLYSGKQGYNGKPFRIVYYLFFPVHLIIIALITLLI